MRRIRSSILRFGLCAALLLPLVTSALPQRLGDLDEDGQPTVLDLVRLINHLNATNATAPEVLPSPLLPYGDLNEDGVIDAKDMEFLVQAILGATALPNPYAAPVVSSPVASTNGTNILISGVARPYRTILVQGGAGTFNTQSDSNGNFSVLVTLQSNRLNNLFLTASNGTFSSGIPQPLKIIQDSEAPSLYIDFPTNGATLYTSNTVVAGRVGDMLSGFMGLAVTLNSQPTSTNLLTANVNVGIGNNGTFERSQVPLALGTNLITVTAADIHGNSTFRVVRVVRGQLTGPRLLVTSGDLQATNIHRPLGQPIVVKATQADGVTPLPNKLITLQVTRSDGRLLPMDDTQLAAPITTRADYTLSGSMLLQLYTDAQGEARARWTLGGDAGCGNNRVCATSAGIANNAYFCASARPAPVHQINIGAGNNQKAETGSFLSEPLRAWASDSCNGVSNLPITFTIVQGAGRLFPSPGGEGQGEGASNSVTVLSTATGHAEALLQLGPDAGQNVIEANYPGNPGLPATFIAYGVARDPARPTTFTGLVLDNSSQPIGHALCEIFVPGNASPVLLTYSDAQGQFTFTNPPTGPIDLSIFGTYANTLGGNPIPFGSFPFLSYSLTIIPNAENSLPKPVLLPRLNVNNARTYYGTNDLVLTCEGMDGLKMTIKAGSMRDARGLLVTPQNPAQVSLNQVHHDQIPMAIPDGASPPFAWTLQPARSTFNPPIQIEYPNMSGLPAGTIAYFLTFNHDTERFEIVASGHVDEQGAKITSDPGAGLNIAGWGCNCPPYSVTGDCENCETSCNISGSLLGGKATTSALIVCPGQSVTFAVKDVSDTGGQKKKVCKKAGTSYINVSPAAVTYTWVVRTNGLKVASGSGSSATLLLRNPATYICEFTANVKRDCAPSSITLISPAAKAFALVAIEADIEDYPPDVTKFASGVNPDTIRVTLNGFPVSANVTPIPTGYHIYYMPECNELNPSSLNTVTIRVRDNANAGADGNPDNGGNESSPDPFSWTFFAQ